MAVQLTDRPVTGTPTRAPMVYRGRHVQAAPQVAVVLQHTPIQSHASVRGVDGHNDVVHVTVQPGRLPLAELGTDCIALHNTAMQQLL